MLASKGAVAADAVAWASAVVAPARRALSVSSSSSSSSSSSPPPHLPFSIPLLVTGDLTHAKTRDGGTRQSRAEWKAYGELLEGLERGAGISETLVLDVRGNHDGFDVPGRGSAQDHFPEFAAAGRRSRSAEGKKGAAVADRRVYAAAVSASGEVTHLDDAVDDESLVASSPPSSSSYPAPLPSCPALLLLGIDAAQDPGLSGSNNFAGRLTLELSEKVVSAARVLRRAAAAACGNGGASASSPSSSSPPLLAYGHFPLSTVEKSAASSGRERRREKKEKGKSGGVSSLPSSSPSSKDGSDLPLPSLPPSLSDLLSSRLVSADAYVAGHLHSLFGGRMHRALEKEEASSERNGNDDNDNAVLAEWEAASFADSRRFRLLVADRGHLTFSDWHWHSPAGPAAYANSTMSNDAHEDASTTPTPFVSAAVSATAALQPSRAAAGAWLLHLSSPPDARFAASSGGSTSSGLALGSLRALALPLALGGGGGGGASRDPLPPGRVRALWRCVPSGQRGGAELLPVSSPSSSSSSFFFEAPWPEGEKEGCPAGDHVAEVELEAFAEGAAGGGGAAGGKEEEAAAAAVAAARAPARPVALVPSPSSSSSSPSLRTTVGVGPHGPRFPLPVDNSRFEAFFLSVDWARFARGLFWALWGGWLLAGLLLPRAAAVAFRQSQRKKKVNNKTENGDDDLGDALSDAASRARPAVVGPLVAGLLTWPLVAAVDNASSSSSGSGEEEEETERGANNEGGDGGDGKSSASSSSSSSSSSSFSFSSFFSAAPRLWRLQVLYACYIALGPWAVVRTLSASPPGLYFPWGVLVQMPSAGAAAEVHASDDGIGAAAASSLSRLLRVSSVFSFLSSLSAVPTPDAARVGAMHLCLCVAPFSLWLAAVVSALRRGERRRTKVVGGGAAAAAAAAGGGAASEPLLRLAPPASSSSARRASAGSSPTRRGGEAEVVTTLRTSGAKAPQPAASKEGAAAGGGGAAPAPPPPLISLLLALATTAVLLSGWGACCWLSLNLAKHVAWQVGGSPAIATGLGLTWGAPAGATLLAAGRAVESLRRRRRMRRRRLSGVGGGGAGKKGE